MHHALLIGTLAISPTITPAIPTTAIAASPQTPVARPAPVMEAGAAATVVSGGVPGTQGLPRLGGASHGPRQRAGGMQRQLGLCPIPCGA